MARTAWCLACLGTALLLLAFYWHPIGAPVGLLLATLLLASAVKPYEALQVIAALLPLSTILFTLFGIGVGGWRLIEGMTLAFIAGVSGNYAVTGEPIRVHPAMRWTAVALLTAILASGVISAAVSMTEGAGSVTLPAIDLWYRSYAVHVDATTFALQFAEGVLLSLLAAGICARVPHGIGAVVRMTVVGAAAATLFNVMRIAIDGALVREHPLPAFVELLLHLRVNVHHGDLNAAGSYFSMAVFLAVAIALRHRAWGGAALTLIAAGLWIAGSRVALASAVIVGAFWTAGLLRHRMRRTVAMGALAATALGVIVVISLSSFGRHVADPSLALKIRMGLAEGALHMAYDHPVFGVGVGQFYELSGTYVDVPNYIVRENAHNNFLQVLAELGVPGLFLFVTLTGLGLASARRKGGWTLTCVLAGLVAYLLTSLGGHPLLVQHSALPFWIVLGVAAASSTRLPALRAVRVVGIGLAILYLVTVPWRIVHATRHADLQHTSAGLSVWQHDESGRRYRHAAARSTFYVPSAGVEVRLEVRPGDYAPGETEVRVYLDGREGHRVVLSSRDWTTIRLPLLNRPHPFTRIDIEARAPGAAEPLDEDLRADGGALDITRPLIRSRSR